MQILLDIARSSDKLPVLFVTHLLDAALDDNHESMIDQLLPVLARQKQYQSILKIKANAILQEMKSQEDAKNIRLLEKYHLLFQHARHLLTSADLCSVIDRLIKSSSHSSISYSIFDTRYILAMIILNSLSVGDKYLPFLQQTWTSILRDLNQVTHLKPIVVAYGKHWTEVMQNKTTIEDINALVRCLDDQYEIVSKIIEGMGQSQCEEWMEKTIQPIVRFDSFEMNSNISPLVSREFPSNIKKTDSFDIDKHFNC